jgi:hypothetical protein
MSLLSKTSLLIIVLAISSVFAAEMISPVYSYTSAAPAQRTGSPGDGATCNACHSGTPALVPGLITSDVPASGYIPGQTYTITATVSEAGRVKYGFEISPQDLVGSLMGTLSVTDPTKTQLVGSNKYITHKTAGTSFPGGIASWSFSWTAPAAGSGEVVLYGAFNASNNSGSTSGDIIRLSTLTLQEDVSAGVGEQAEQDFVLFPNPASDKVFLDAQLMQESSFVITDINGKQIKSYGENELSQDSGIDISYLQSGMYVLELRSPKGVTRKKFIKR